MQNPETFFLFFGVTSKDIEVLEYFRCSTKEFVMHKVFALNSSLLPVDMDEISRASGYKIIFPIDVKRSQGVSKETTDVSVLLAAGPYSIFYVEEGKEYHYMGQPINPNGAKAVRVIIQDGEACVSDVAWMASVLESEL